MFLKLLKNIFINLFIIYKNSKQTLKKKHKKTQRKKHVKGIKVFFEEKKDKIGKEVEKYINILLKKKRKGGSIIKNESRRYLSVEEIII